MDHKQLQSKVHFSASRLDLEYWFQFLAPIVSHRSVFSVIQELHCNLLLLSLQFKLACPHMITAAGPQNKRVQEVYLKKKSNHKASAFAHYPRVPD